MMLNFKKYYFNKGFLLSVLALAFSLILIFLSYSNTVSNSASSASCSDFNAQQSTCQATAGCTYPGNQGACSVFSLNQSTCQATAGCTYPGNAGPCSDFNGSQSTCQATVGCSYPGNAGNCSAFNSNQGACQAQMGCTYPGNAGNCSDFSSPETCSPSGCSSSYTDCGGFNGNESGCTSTSGCSWDGGNSSCSGNYFSGCSGSYDNGACTGSYDNGACTGGYDNGLCTGSYDNGACTGTYDNTAPVFQTATVNGTTLTLLYNETLDSGSTPANNDFVVTVNGPTATVSNVAVTGGSVVLTLNAPVVSGDSVGISYTAGGNPIQDAAGNDASNFASYSVTNNSPDTTAPVLQTATVNGAILTLTYNEALDTGSIPSGSEFSVTVNGNSRAVDTVSIPSGSSVLLGLAGSVAQGNTVVISYAGSISPIQDLVSNDASIFSDQSVTNNTTDVTAPAVTSATSSKDPGLYTIGEVIHIQVDFSEAVTSTGNVTVTLDTGGTCTFTVSNSDTGTCDYTVGSGENSSDLTVSSITGTVNDGASNALVTPATPTSNLAANEAIVIDTTSPTVSITAPTNGATVGGASVSITANASDTNLVGVQFKRATNTNIGSEDTTSTYGVTWDTTGLSNGAQTLIAVARDTAGNYATSTAVTVTVNNDTDAPSISAGSPSTQQPEGTTQVTLSVTTDENATCRYGTTPDTAYNSISNTFETTGGTSHSQTITGLTDDTTYLYYVRCTDNTNANTNDYTITFDIAAPTVVVEEEQGSVAGGYSQGNTNTNFSLIENIRQKLVSTILSLIARLQEQLNSQTNTPASDTSPQDTNITFNINLEYPVTHPDVLRLQQFLNNNNFTVSLTGAGSKDNETDYFGLQTQSALIQFQKANNITPAIGFFGEVTRGVVNGR